MNPITNHMTIDHKAILKETVHDLLILPILKNEPSGQGFKRTQGTDTGLIPLKRIKREPGTYTAGIHSTTNTTALSTTKQRRRLVGG